MPLAYTTCTETCGNGVRIIGMIITRERQAMAARGCLSERINLGCCVAVLGLSTLNTAVQRIATATARSTTATLSDFE